MKITRAVALIGAALVLAGCSSVNTNSDQAGLHYSAGSWSDTTFGECVKPGTQEYYGPGDLNYVYPSGTRTYKFETDAPGAEQGSIKATSSDNQEMSVRGILSFALNTDCEVLRKFHERIGLKYGAGSEGVERWTELLNDYLGQPLTSAVNDAADGYTALELYSDATKRTEWEKAVKENLPDAVKDLAGGEFFTDFTLVLQRPTPPQQLLDQLQEQQTQAERINTINAQAASQAQELAQMQQLVELFGGWEGYIAYRNQLACEQSSESCVPFLPIPQGSGVNVTPAG